MADELVLLNDLSYHQAESPPFKEMHENGVVMAFIKGSMGFGIDLRAEQHVNAARNGGMPPALYHWIDPISTPARQGGYCISMLEKHKIGHLMFDDEQSWSSWQKYTDYINKKIPWDQVPKAGVQQLEDALLGTVEWVTSRAEVRWAMYSGYYFLQGYHKLNPDVIALYKRAPARVWAEYDDSALGRRKVTWDQLRALALASHLDSRMRVPESARCPADDAQQFTSSVIIPGYSVNMDFSKWTRSAWEAWSGIEPEVRVPFLSLDEAGQDAVVLRVLQRIGEADAEGRVLAP
jgi:hypothetical protein